MTDVDLLLDYLHGQRRHVLSAVDGLTADQLRTAMLPTGWTFVSMINHLIVDVERFWFRAVFAAEPDVTAYYESATDDGWAVPADRDPADVVAEYRAEAQRCDQIIASLPWDSPPRWWFPDQGSTHLADLREGVLHVITETAAHAGHLDAARELLDGRTWLVLT